MNRNIASKITRLALLASIATAGLALTARAQLIELTLGGFTINANGYSAATITSPAPGALPTTAGPLEDSWGIFQITSILAGATPVFTDNLGSEFWGIFYNSYDTTTTDLGSGNLSFTSQGLLLDIYDVNVLDAGDALFAAVYNQGTAGRLTASQYNGISNAGSLVLSSSLTGTMQSFYVGFNSSTFATGNLDVTFNNMFDIADGSLGLLSFALSGLTNDVPSNWTVKFDGPIDGTFAPVPEPSTYGAMAAALLVGVIAFRRRQSRSTMPVAV